VDLQALVRDAAALHRTGRLSEALGLYRRALLVRPNLPTILALAAEVLLRMNAPADGARLARRAVTVDPGKSALHNLAAYACAVSGDIPRAERAYAAAFLADPGNLSILKDWSLAARSRNPAAGVAVLRRWAVYAPDHAGIWRRLAEAQAVLDLGQSRRNYRRALSSRPDDAIAWKAFGIVETAAGAEQSDQESAFRRAVLLSPADGEACRWLATATAAGSDAVRRFRRAGRAAPGDVTVWFGLGSAYYRTGHPVEADRAYRRVLILDPSHADGNSNRLVIMTESGMSDTVILRNYDRLLALDPIRGRTLVNLSKRFMDRGEYSVAERYVKRALVSGQTDRGLMLALCGIFRQTRRHAAAARQVRRSEVLFPNDASMRSIRLMELSYREGVNAAALYRAHTGWARRWAPAERPLGYAVDRDPARRLRLGFVSPDLKRHPVGYFMKPLLAHLDRAAFEVTLFSDGSPADELAERLRALADKWVESSDLDNERLRNLITGGRIDILFDLAGHTPGNRLDLFAMRGAPLQMTWMGYVGTTGLPTMDYLVTDRFQTRAGTEDCYSERWLTLPDDYICYEPVPYAPAVAPCPAIAKGHITFGSFNNPAKLTDRCLALWARVLQAVPGSHLLLAYRGFNDREVQRGIRDFLAARGVAPGRVEFALYPEHEAFLGGYANMDIALDTMPYSGGLTTCEALWMGVPVVALSTSDNFAGRHSYSHLSNAGFPEWVAGDDDGFVETARRLASDIDGLTAIRKSLREKLLASPLCDQTRYAKGVEAALRQAWQRYCGEN